MSPTSHRSRSLAATSPQGDATQLATATAAATSETTKTATATPTGSTRTATGILTRAGVTGDHTIGFAPTADAFTDAVRPTSNYGSSEELLVDLPSVRERNAHLAFSVEGLPSDASNVSARLLLRPTVVRPYRVVAYQSGPFQEQQVTWRTRPDTTATLGSGDVPVTGELALDVSQAVRGDGAVYLTLKAEGSTHRWSTRFASREGSDPPRLEVSFDSSDPPPTSEPTTPPAPPATSPAAAPPPPPPATQSGKMLVGASVLGHNGRSGTEEWAFLEANVGQLDIHRVYDSGFTLDFRRKAGLDIGQQATHYSFKPDMARLGRGDIDGEIRTFLDSIPKGHRTMLTLWHEPEDNFTSAQQKADYRAGWRRFSQLVRATGRSELSTSWVMMAWSWCSGSGRNPEDWWPGDGVVDSVGFDAYNEGSLKGSRWDSPGREHGMPASGDSGKAGGYTAGGTIAWARAHNVAWGVAEWGSLENTNGLSASWTSTPTKAEWIKDAAEFYAKQGAQYIEYFHAGPYRGPWWLDSSPAALRAYRDVNATY